MNLVEQINRLLGTDSQEIISAGQVVKAMILNGLGFVSAPLYLFEKFFVGKATEHLLGEGIRPEHLNDDRLGRVLDKLYEAGLTEVFVTVALCAARKFGVKMDSLHLDSSSFHVDGDDINNTTAENAEPGGHRNYLWLFKRPSPRLETIYPRLNVQWGLRYSLVSEGRRR